MLAAGLYLLLNAVTPLHAQQPPRAAEPAEEGAEHVNEAALVVAGTAEHEGGSYFTLGAEYERRISRRWGIGGEFELLFDKRSLVVVAPVTFHPGRGWKIFAGAGFERADAEGEDDEVAGSSASERVNHFLMRFGAGYSFEFAERYSLAPSVSFDAIHENEQKARGVVVGVSVGVSFE